MFHYLKTIESLDNLSEGDALFELIGVIKNLEDKASGWRETPSFKFTLYSTDTDISFECELDMYNLRKYNIHYHNGDVVIVSGRYSNGGILVHRLRNADLGLTGNMSKDVLILNQEINSIISVQGQNGYISENAWGELQELSFKFKREYEKILFL